ncbi:S8 family serine peptidase [Haloarchaeobius sp. DYHT-AS-18]|uniref:S8 family serine peptidase n=1 Tax=Haloarchaeobius sp. DYHT-AS-18 TaxID=3446117 RepID=UPI003EB73A2F
MGTTGTPTTAVVLLVAVLVTAPVVGAVGTAGPISLDAPPAVSIDPGPAVGTAPAVPAERRTEENRTVMTYDVPPPETVPTSELDFPIEKGHSTVIPFHTGPVKLEPGVDPAVYEVDASLVPVVVQFHDTPSDSLLDEHGYEYEETLTYRTAVARLPREAIESFGNQKVVRAVVPLRPEWKRSTVLPVAAEATATVTVVAFAESALFDEYELRQVGDDTYRGTVSGRAIDDLVRSPAVSWVEPYHEPQVGVGQGGLGVNADAVSRLYRGGGISVGVVDTGIAYNHPHFANTTIVGSYDSRDDDQTPEADNWNWSKNDHGIHVAGTIAGQSVSNGVEVVGVAPDATLIVARGLGFANVKRTANDGADIVSNSWGSNVSGFYTNTAGEVDEWARDNDDVLLTFCFGNNGQMGPYAWSPGLAKNVLTVGAVTDGSDGQNVSWGSILDVNDVSTLNDNLLPRDGRRKPDVLAPGTRIYAPSENGTYNSKSGCSMATPHVSGVAALVQEATAPDLTSNQLKALLVATTGPAANPNTLPAGHGLVDTANAIYQNQYESLQQPFAGDIAEDESDWRGFTVGADAEQVVVSLSWLDPKGPNRANDTLVNDLDLYVGPSSDPMRYRADGANDNVEKLVIEDPEAGIWRVTVTGFEVADDATQRYDGVVRVVTAEPGLDLTVNTFQRIRYWEQPNRTIRASLAGTGAPTTGVWLRPNYNNGPLNLCDDGQPFGAHVYGTLSNEETEFWSTCFEVPRRSATYGIDIEVGSTNGPLGSFSERVTLEVVTDMLAPTSRVVGYSSGALTDTLRINATDTIAHATVDPSGVETVSWRVVDRSGVDDPTPVYEGNGSYLRGDIWELEDLPNGSYTVEYWAVDRAGNAESPHSLAVTVDNLPPTPVITVTDTPRVLGLTGTTGTISFDPETVIVPVGAQVTFSGAQSTDNIQVGRHDWNFEDLGFHRLGATTASHTFTQLGYANVTLRAVDVNGNSATTTRRVYVAPADEVITDDGQELTPITGTSTSIIDPGVIGPVFGDVRLAGATLQTPSVATGEPAFVTVDLENTGSAQSPATLALFVDGQLTDQRPVLVAGGTTETVPLRYTPTAPGQYGLVVALLDDSGEIQAALEVGTVQVSGATTTGEGSTTANTSSSGADGTTAAEGETPGFGALLAVVALLATVALRLRRE